MTISSTNRKAGPYIGNGTASVFPFYFKVFTAADVEVVKLTVATNVETTLALTTDYTVSLNTDQNANPGGSITLVAGVLATGFNLVVTSDIGNLQPTDLTNQGGFYPDVINDALDRATIQIQQLQEAVDRAALLPITSDTDAAALVADIERLASSADNLDIDANNIASINTVAGSISNVNSVASNITNVNAVAGNATNINAVNANSTNINAVNANKTNIDTVAGNNTNITTVAGISANVTTVAGISSNVTSVAGNSTNINAVAGNATNINAVNSNSTNINAVAGNSTNINAVNSNKTNIDTCATNIAAIIDAPTQASNAANSAAQAAASAAAGMYSAVQDKSANYTVVAGDAGDLIRVTTTSGAITITLPLIGSTGITDGFKIAVVKWTSDANVVNIARSGSNTINGATSAQIGSQYSQIIFVADAETSTWFASQSGLGATNINVDVFTGNNSTTAFTLTSDPSTKNNTYVFISGVYQQKSTYSLSGTTLTFSTAPPTGTSNIEVAYATPLAIGTPSDGTVTPAKLSTGAPTWNASGNMAVNGVTPSAWGAGQAIDLTGNTGIWGNTGAILSAASNTYFDGTNWRAKVTGASGILQVGPGSLAAFGAPSVSAGAITAPVSLFAVQTNQTFGLQNATISSGTGIAFPPTQSASSDANTLDDYEEGTFTPTITAASGALGGGGSLVGSYTKIGRFVYATMNMTGLSKGTLSGQITVGGLPFSVATGNTTGTFRYGLGGTPAAGTTLIMPQSGGGTGMELQMFSGTGYLGNLAASNLGATFEFYNITYIYQTS